MINSKVVKKLTSKINIKSFLILIGIAVVLSVILLINKQEKFEPKSPSERYFISSKEQPNFKEVILNPFDFQPNEEQIVYVKLENPNPIGKVSAIITTDKKVQNYELELFEGNEKIGTWKGSWRINDTHNYTYRQTFKAVSGTDKSQVDLTFK